MPERLSVGDLRLQLRSSTRRRTLELTVERDGNLVVAAPEGCELKTIETFVQEKRFWIYTKLAEKEVLARPVHRKEFVTGEGFRYLGRDYRLLLVSQQDVPLKLHGGRFRLIRSEAARGREHFVAWYRAYGQPWMVHRVERLAERFGTPIGKVRVLDLGFRWGSSGQGRTLNFHWAALLLPPRIVDYIVAHELAHLWEKRHTPAFWRRLERAMPDFEERKAWLAERGGEVLSI